MKAMKARTKRKTVLSILLCCMLAFTMMPAMAFAEDETPSPAFRGPEQKLIRG